MWACEPFDVQALLPQPDRWQRQEQESELFGHFTCWEFKHDEYIVTVCSPQRVDLVDPADLRDSEDPEDLVPEEIRQLLPCVRYRIGIVMEPINPPRSGWAFLNQVITAPAVKGPGLGFDVFTNEPIRPSSN